jgi:hypothetical protein
VTEQQHWPEAAPPPASASPAPVSASEHPGLDVLEPWASTAWAVVTASGIVQARCGRTSSGVVCNAWRLSRPGGATWRACYACGSGNVPVPIQDAGAEVAAAVARAGPPETS